MINCIILHQLCKKQGDALSRYCDKCFIGLHQHHPILLIINRYIYTHTYMHAHTHTCSFLQSVKKWVMQDDADDAI